MIVVRVGRGDAGSCRHGCTEDRQGVVALVAIGDGADAERAHEACSSSRAGELLHGGGVRSRRCAVAIIMVIIVFGGGSGRCARRRDARQGRRAARSRVGARGQSVARARRSGRGSIGGQAERRAEARDHDRPSVPITMIITSVGLGDSGPFRRGSTDVRRSVVALVAIGDGAEAEHSHGTSKPSGEGAARGGVRTLRCAVAMDIITGTGGSARGRGAGRCSPRRRRAARPRVGLRGWNRSRIRCCEANVCRRCAAPGQTRCRSRGGDNTRRFERERRLREARRRRTPLMTLVVKHDEAADALRHRPLLLSHAPLTRPRSSQVCPACGLCRRGCR